MSNVLTPPLPPAASETSSPDSRSAAPLARPEGAVRIIAMDVDRTLIDGQSQIYLARALFKARLFPWWAYLRILGWQVRHRYFNWRPDHMRLQQMSLKPLAGIPATRMAEMFRHTVDVEILPRVRPEGLATVRRWQNEGALVLLVSGAIEPLISLLAQAIGADGVIATKMRDGGAVETGEIEGLTVQGEEKWRRLMDYAVLNFESWSLEAAYGDDESDVPLLTRARQIFAVNPRPDLNAVALARGWTILDWSAQGAQSKA